MSRGIRLYAHRGATVNQPENTIAAFRQALDDGANALELDIHRTRDGIFVVCHDADGHRTAGIRERISRLEIKAIKRWRLAKNQQVPTLEEVLEAFPRVPMSIDIKPPAPKVVAPLLDILTRRGAETHVTLASFHHNQIARVRKLGWRGRTALSRFEIAALKFLPFSLARGLIIGDAAQIPRSIGRIRLDDPVFLSRCHALGIRIDYWVVNNPDEACDMLARGATGVMSDDPARIAPAIF